MAGKKWRLGTGYSDWQARIKVISIGKENPDGAIVLSGTAYDLLRDRLPAFIEQCIAEANDHLRDATKKGGGDHFADVSKKGEQSP